MRKAYNNRYEKSKKVGDMFEQVEKPKENKSRSVSNSVAQKKSNVKQGFGFVDNRPEAVAQNKLKDMANSYSVQQQRAIPKKSNTAKSLVIQKTKWVHDGVQWNATSSSSSDTDPFPLPSIAHPSAKKDDQYDQQTGVYNSSLDNSLSSLASSSGPMGFYDRRSTTGFKYASGHNRQGPHTLAHITKRVAMSAAVNTGRDPLKLIGSRAFPRPRVMNKRLRDRLKSRGPNWKKNTRKMRTNYLRNYKKKWSQSHLQPTKKRRLNALKGGMELNPSTVYNIGKGSATSSEMAGKGESRKVGASDLRTLISTPGSLTSASVAGLTTMDLSGATIVEQQDALGMVEDIRDLLVRDDVGSDPGDSESDSDMSDLDDI